ncbi:hypothetical protein FQR65_LT03807 [Abscondita terminalis]|nr:hypothetical protein FQR65_LT03807 [Abscondita terminalis]
MSRRVTRHDMDKTADADYNSKVKEDFNAKIFQVIDTLMNHFKWFVMEFLALKLAVGLGYENYLEKDIFMPETILTNRMEKCPLKFDSQLMVVAAGVVSENEKIVDVCWFIIKL